VESRGTKPVVQRRARGAWRTVGTGTVLGGQAEVVVVLPRGDQRLRVVLTIGAQELVSPARGVTVRAARRWSTRAADDGRYTGRGGSRSVRLRVAKAGRELRGFSASVAMLCPSLSPGQFTTQIGNAAIARIRVAPDGRFVAASTPRPDTAIQVRVRLRHRKVTAGRVKLSIGACSGNAAFSAARAG
jgi:hypothetical protein